jgi:hypothetical protein
MIDSARLVGKKLSEIEIAKEFRESYEKFNQLNNEKLKDYFYQTKKAQAQFEGFWMLYPQYKESFKEIKGINTFNEKCGRLATALQLIIHLLNNFEIDGYIHNIVENPFDNDHEIAKELVNNENWVKLELKTILQLENVEDLYASISSLRKIFLESELFNYYINSFSNKKELIKSELNIQSLFFIIRQIIYQYVLDNQIKYIKEDQIISHTISSYEGNLLTVEFTPLINLQYHLNVFEIIEIFYENKKELCTINLLNGEWSKEKGFLYKIEGETITSQGIDINSPSNANINRHLKRFG